MIATEASPRVTPETRPTRWWLAILQKRAERLYEGELMLDEPIVWSSEEQRAAAIAFFKAADRAEESGRGHVHPLAGVRAAEAAVEREQVDARAL